MSQASALGSHLACTPRAGRTVVVGAKSVVGGSAVLCSVDILASVGAVLGAVGGAAVVLGVVVAVVGAVVVETDVVHPALVSVLTLLLFEHVHPDAALHDSDSVRLCCLPHPLSLHPPNE